MKRRHFIQTAGYSIGAALLLKPHDFFSESGGAGIDYPSAVKAIIDEQLVVLRGKQDRWEYNNTIVQMKRKNAALEIEIKAPGAALSEVQLVWNVPLTQNALLYNDHWERTYGDSGWHKIKPGELFPWFFMEYNGGTTSGFGVKTGCHSFCSWLLGDGSMTLIADTRNGGSGVQLGQRKLQAAAVVTFKSREGEDHFTASRRFAKLMCEKPRLPKQPVYGINDWYVAYGNNSSKLILEHTNLVAPLAAGLSNRPFSVIDDGWFVVTEKGNTADVTKPNERFGDMKKLAAQIVEAGMRPGLWTRPLLAVERTKNSLVLPNTNKSVYDPSIDENLARVAAMFSAYKEWDYELVKFDYTSWDIFQQWGFQMMSQQRMAKRSGWNMNDKSKTNAEIILSLYKTIRQAAGNMYIMGCNTFSHLSAGLFEVNRIGDDTSGNEWERTRKMGVNTLAARAFTHNIFYAADPDCVGLTTKIDWKRNKQWMELVAQSGTPLFISAQKEAAGEAQKVFIKQSFEYASKAIPVGEPLDWMENLVPSKWKLNGTVKEFNWE